MNRPPMRLAGIVPPLVTPLSAPDRLDLPGLQRLIEHVIGGGVHGIFLLGSTGEAPSLSYRLRRQLIDHACRLIDGRVRVLVGITDTAFVESVRMAEVAADCGADALVLSTPYYFPAGQTELIGYVKNITRQLPLPLVLYNMPALTKVWFEIPTLQQLASIDRIIGIKDSSGDLAYFQRLMDLRAQRPDWSIMIGPERMLPDAMRLGGDGSVAGGANVYPRLFVDCYQAIADGNAARVAELHAKIVQLQQIYDIGKYASRHIKATKCALSLLGICDDAMAEPFHRFHPPQRQRICELLHQLALEPMPLEAPPRPASTGADGQTVSAHAAAPAPPSPGGDR